MIDLQFKSTLDDSPSHFDVEVVDGDDTRVIGQVWLDRKKRLWFWRHGKIQGLGCKLRHEASLRLARSYFGDPELELGEKTTLALIVVKYRKSERGGYWVYSKLYGNLGRVWKNQLGNRWSWECGRKNGHWCNSRELACKQVVAAFAKGRSA